MCPLQLPTYSSHQKLPDGVAVHVNFSRPFCTVGWFLKVEKVHLYMSNISSKYGKYIFVTYGTFLPFLAYFVIKVN